MAIAEEVAVAVAVALAVALAVGHSDSLVAYRTRLNGFAKFHTSFYMKINPKTHFNLAAACEASAVRSAGVRHELDRAIRAVRAAVLDGRGSQRLTYYRTFVFCTLCAFASANEASLINALYETHTKILYKL